jgi:hypothetical protein
MNQIHVRAGHVPFWSIVVIALDVWVIWAITRPGALDDV